ncbi:MAG TPA: tryptophan synthase subunit alpha [Epulopiscium sp.]|nr:tryptophan synthase subunit alpha [Candidatus Epulonipiscium sp.]
MNRISKKMSELMENNITALISYITAGDPSIEQTEDLVYALERGGSHIVELGIPHSDPVADGPVVQDAVQRSLSAGTKIKDIFECVRRIRLNSQVPIAFLVYYNMIHAYGVKNFVEECARVGVDGLVIPDLPLEERDEITPYLTGDKVALIPLVAPTSKSRIKKVTNGGSGFVYCVSSMGVTGQESVFHKDINLFLKTVRQSTELPIAVGFGISSKADVERFKGLVDGVIIGSAIIKEIYRCKADLQEVEKIVSQLIL